jgi:hypothetical protein
VPAIKSVIIRPAAKRYGQDKDFEMSSFLENEFSNQGISAQIIAAPYDAMARIAELNLKLNALQAAAARVVAAVEEGSSKLAKHVRALETQIKASQS